MTDLTQSNWYDADLDSDCSNPFTKYERHGNPMLREYLRLGGKLSDYAGTVAQVAERQDVNSPGYVVSITTHPPVLDLWSRFDRALGLTPQMEKAAAAE